eukprot:scaffold75465_cov33-Prasinocladus_malaysianus.AAC.1
MHDARPKVCTMRQHLSCCAIMYPKSNSIGREVVTYLTNASAAIKMMVDTPTQTAQDRNGISICKFAAWQNCPSCCADKVGLLARTPTGAAATRFLEALQVVRRGPGHIGAREA